MLIFVCIFILLVDADSPSMGHSFLRNNFKEVAKLICLKFT